MNNFKSTHARLTGVFQLEAWSCLPYRHKTKAAGSSLMRTSSTILGEAGKYKGNCCKAVPKQVDRGTGRTQLLVKTMNNELWNENRLQDYVQRNQEHKWLVKKILFFYLRGTNSWPSDYSAIWLNFFEMVPGSIQWPTCLHACLVFKRQTGCWFNPRGWPTFWFYVF